jgi:hypothetical protein
MKSSSYLVKRCEQIKHQNICICSLKSIVLLVHALRMCKANNWCRSTESFGTARTLCIILLFYHLRNRPDYILFKPASSLKTPQSCNYELVSSVHPHSSIRTVSIFMPQQKGGYWVAGLCGFLQCLTHYIVLDNQAFLVDMLTCISICYGNKDVEEICTKELAHRADVVLI